MNVEFSADLARCRRRAALLVDGEWHESGAVKKVMEAAGHPERTAA